MANLSKPLPWLSARERISSIGCRLRFLQANKGASIVCRSWLPKVVHAGEAHRCHLLQLLARTWKGVAISGVLHSLVCQRLKSQSGTNHPLTPANVPFNNGERNRGSGFCCHWYGAGILLRSFCLTSWSLLFTVKCYWFSIYSSGV